MRLIGATANLCTTGSIHSILHVSFSISKTLGVSKTTIEYLARSFFIGQILGSLGLARIPDLFGRKWPIIYALAA
jgi:MFS family permease